MTKRTSIHDLNLADIVRLFDGPYGFATVKQITTDVVVFFRPYVLTQDFSYTGGVICSIGIEECRYHNYPKCEHTFDVVEKARPLK